MASNPKAGPSFAAQVEALEEDWATNPRWNGVRRDYSAADVVGLRGSVVPECTLARAGASKLWQRLHDMEYVHALGAMTGGQAVQFAKAGLPALYLSGWQVAGDANLAGQVYPDQSLYPANSVPSVVARLNNALRRADQIEWNETSGRPSRDYMLPIVADAEAGFGGPLNAYELMKAMIESGAMRPASRRVPATRTPPRTMRSARSPQRMNVSRMTLPRFSWRFGSSTCWVTSAR